MWFPEAAARLERTVIAPWESIHEAVRHLERAGTGALLVCDEHRRLCALLTDGDVRRAILAGIPFAQPCRLIATAQPVVAGPDLSAAEALALMDGAREFVLNQLPIVDQHGMALGLLLRSDLITHGRADLSALIMAGGFGKRLLPLTEHTPKPLLPVGGRPLLDRTIERLQRAGIRQVVVSTHHLADRISEHLGLTESSGVAIRCVSEDRPLGTAGAIRLLGELSEPLLVINGDIMTGIRFDDMLAFHRRHGAALTVGVRRCEVEIPYGVVETDGPLLSSVREKPRLGFLINAGVYLLEPEIYDEIPEGCRFDMTDLIERLVQHGRPVACFPIVEYWLDIGRPDDYEQAQRDVQTLEVSA